MEKQHKGLLDHTPGENLCCGLPPRKHTDFVVAAMGVEKQHEGLLDHSPGENLCCVLPHTRARFSGRWMIYELCLTHEISLGKGSDTPCRAPAIALQEVVTHQFCWVGVQTRVIVVARCSLALC